MPSSTEYSSRVNLDRYMLEKPLSDSPNVAFSQAKMAAPPAKVDRQTTTPFHLKLFYKHGSFPRFAIRPEYAFYTSDTELQLTDPRPDEFANPESLPRHLQVYTWQNCTLRELSHLLTSALPSLLPDPPIATRLSFRLVFPDTRSAPSTSSGMQVPRYMSKDLGSVVIGEGGPGVLPVDEDEARLVEGGMVAGEVGGEPEKTLAEARFVVGDYVCCAVLPPMASGDVAPPFAPTVRSGGFVGSGGAVGRGGMGGGGEFRGPPGGPRENGFGGGGFRVRGGARGGSNGFGGGGGGGFGGAPSMGIGMGGVPNGEWRRGERIPEGPSGGGGRGGYGGGRGRGRY